MADVAKLWGFLAAFGAAVAFGIQYVPVKRYEIHDGATFQWFMCSGILMTGFIISLVSGDLERGCSELVILGGVLWALSNYFVLPLVKLLGIGLGFALYHFVNLVVGYCVGRFGLFGMPLLEGELVMCDLGCALILSSFIVMIFVETDGMNEDQKDAETALSNAEAAHHPSRNLELGPQEPGSGTLDWNPQAPEVEQATDQESGEGTEGEEEVKVQAALLDQAAGLLFLPVTNATEQAGKLGPSYQSVGGFTSHGEPIGPSLALPVPTSQETRGGSSSSFPSQGLQRRVCGVGLALLAGGICGVQAVPASLHQSQRKDEPPTAVVFPQCLGIWAASSGIYVLYSSMAQCRGWKVPHAAIRPAYTSGCIWACGFALMIVGIRDLGYSVGYMLDAVGPIVVSSLLSLTVFREIRGFRQILLYFVAFSLQMVGVVFISVYGHNAS